MPEGWELLGSRQNGQAGGEPAGLKGPGFVWELLGHWQLEMLGAWSPAPLVALAWHSLNPSLCHQEP